MKKMLKHAILAMAVLCSATAVQADTSVTVDGGWTPFGFGVANTFSFGDHFTFTAAGPVNLTVTDAFLSGDQFSVYDNLVLIGSTSLPLSTGDSIGSNYDGALADARWSSGVFALGAGPHSVDIFVLLSPFDGGGAALRVDSASPVPEPSSIALAGLGGLGLAFGAYRRRKAAAAV